MVFLLSKAGSLYLGYLQRPCSPSAMYTGLRQERVNTVRTILEQGKLNQGVNTTLFLLLKNSLEDFSEDPQGAKQDSLCWQQEQSVQSCYLDWPSFFLSCPPGPYSTLLFVGFSSLNIPAAQRPYAQAEIAGTATRAHGVSLSRPLANTLQRCSCTAVSP